MKKILLLPVVYLFFLACNNPVKKEQLVHLLGTAQGSTYSIKYFDTENKDYQTSVDSIVKKVDESMSTYLPESLISKINQSRRRVKVDTLFKTVFEKSVEIWEKSDSLFDPTVGALVNAWGFGPEGQIALDSLKIDSILQFTGLEKVSINEKSYFVKQDARTQINFNAIAQGYTVDLIAGFLENKNIENYLVELGGEIRAKGKNLSNNFDWLVAIDNPQAAENRSFIATLKLKNMSLATSGNYRKFIIDTVTGEKYVHTINPKTGYPKKSNVLSASVIAADCMTADGYATVLMAMDLDKSKVLLDSLADTLDAFIIYLDGNNNIKKYITPGFSNYLIE